MDFALTEDQEAFVSMARKFAETEFEPNAETWDREYIFPREVLQHCAQLGFGGIYVDPALGGTGMSRLDAALVFEQLARGCPSTAAFLSIHNMATWMIDRFGSDALREKFLPDLCTMDKIVSYCLTEPNAGSDAASLATMAISEGEDYVVNGQKAFISGAGSSDLYLTMVRTSDEGARGVSCLVIEKDTPGLSFGAQERKLGWHSQPTAAVYFDGCRVPKANLVGAEREGFSIAMSGLDGGRLNIGACSLGGAGVCLDKTLGYVTERRQFSQPIASFQATQFRLADMATELEAARLLLYRAAAMVESGARGKTKFAAMAKRYATDVGFDVVNKAMQLHGGYGYLQDFPFERILRDLRVHQILEGTNEIMRVIISRDMLKDHVPT